MSTSMSDSDPITKYSPVSQYPARLHATKVFRELAKATQQDTLAIYLSGADLKYLNDSDRELPHRCVTHCVTLRSSLAFKIKLSSIDSSRQENNFFYLTGCDIVGSRLLAWCKKNENPKEAEDDLTITSTLFIPDIDDDDVM